MEKRAWSDGMLGVIVGDALGVPVQFMCREAILSRPQGPVKGMEGFGCYNMPAGSWSDDSSMALAALDSMINCGGINTDDIMERFILWNDDNYYTPTNMSFDQGCTCMEALSNYKAERNSNTCGITGEYANGNGALMRIMPACLYAIAAEEKQQITTEEAVALIHKIAGLTHNHLRSHTACGLYFFMARAILRLKGTGATLHQALQSGIDEGIRFYREQGLDSQLYYYECVTDLDALAKIPVENVRSSGYVVHTVHGVMWSLMNGKDLPDILLTAVNLGKDTDTVAAIAGGLAGLWFGEEAIPAEWLAVIPKMKTLKRMFSQAADLF